MSISPTTLRRRQTLLDLHARGHISDATYRRCERELDLAEDRIS